MTFWPTIERKPKFKTIPAKTFSQNWIQGDTILTMTCNKQSKATSKAKWLALKNMYDQPKTDFMFSLTLALTITDRQG